MNKYALVRFRGSYVEVDIDDMGSANRLLGIIGRDGALQLHVPSTKFPTHYLFDSQTLIFLWKMRNWILNRNRTKCTNADTRLTPKSFYEPTLNRQIDIHDMGGEEAFNDFMDHLWNMGGELKHDKGTKEAILESESLIHGHRMGGNSAGNQKMSGSLSDRITKTLIYGKQGKSDIDLRIGRMEKALSDFAKHAKSKNQRKEKQYRERPKEIQEKLKKLETREKNNNLQWG